MNALGFSTPVFYGAYATTAKEKAIQRIGNYFSICGKRAIVIRDLPEAGKEKVFLSKQNFSLKTLLKVIAVVLSHFTVIIPLALFVTHLILRSSCRYVVVEREEELGKVKEKRLADSKVALESGIEIPETTIEKIQLLMPKILEGKLCDEIKYLPSCNNLIFQLKGDEGFIFKRSDSWHGKYDGIRIQNNEGTRGRFENMVKAVDTCREKSLSHLIVPSAKLLEIDFEGTEHFSQGRYVFIAEKALKLATARDDFSRPALTKAVGELAVLIADTGFCDVEPRNILVLEEAEGFSGNLKFGLIDLEHMGHPLDGFLGSSNGSRGLLEFVSIEQSQIALDKAIKSGISLTDLENKAANMRPSLHLHIKQYKALRA